jgi:Transposase IS66 family/IS66 C-terminal element
MSEKHTISFNQLKRSHLPILLEWLNASHVQEFWDTGTVWIEQLVQAKYGSYIEGYKLVDGKKSPLQAFIIYCGADPIGYIQFYDAFLFPTDSYSLQGILKDTPLIDPLVKKVKAILTTRILSKSKLSGAIGHFMGPASYLKNYMANPCARPDNNVAERALKLVVIGPKNWLFVGNEGGGKGSAVIYCLSRTCRALKINPSLYFEDVLRRIQSHPYNKLHELLAQNWAPTN